MADGPSDGRRGMTLNWPRLADVVVCVVLIPAVNWFILVMAAIAYSSKERTCFRSCGEPHFDAWTLAILLPVIVLLATMGLAVISARRKPWRVWIVGRSAAIASLFVVIAVLALRIDALWSIPQWHWLDFLRVSSVG
jgi:hypothetical protein